MCRQVKIHKMCGICCTFPVGFEGTIEQTQLTDDLRKILNNRGPDANAQHILPNGIHFNGFVLWQQGKEPTNQPLISTHSILLINGDIFNAPKHEAVADSTWLISQLDSCQDDKDIIKLLQGIHGPYSLIFYNKRSDCLYFMRDALGRNSLLLERAEKTVRISSSSKVSTNTKTIELPSLGIFKINFESPDKCVLYPWYELTEDQINSIKIVEDILESKIQFQDSIGLSWSIKTRKPPAYNFAEILKSLKNTENVFSNFLRVKVILENVQHLTSLIRKSVKDRVENSPKLCSKCVKKFLINKFDCISCNHAKLGILFSGGIDCTILAVIVHEFVNPDDPIDLINVAFEAVSKKNGTINKDFNVPDRISAKESFDELQKLFPKRQWNLIEINVERDELQSVTQKHICHLIYPLQTVLDESLGCAFWFAGRGQGEINGAAYETTSRVIIVGSGADELFGGYTRHRNAYNRCNGDVSEKIAALRNELDFDWTRIPTRNLGRDDRVIADNGRTSRAPFIEENLVEFVRQLDPMEICCFQLEQGIGDKLLLRLVGHSLGLRRVANFKKRAIQFGSRIADKNQNAKDISEYLKSSD